MQTDRTAPRGGGEPMSENGRTARARWAKDAETASATFPSAPVQQAPLWGAVLGFGKRRGGLTALDTFDWQTQIADQRGGREADASNRDRGFQHEAA